MKPVRPIRIGTRGSMLAKWQAEFVRKKIFQTTGADADIVLLNDSLEINQVWARGLPVR